MADNACLDLNPAHWYIWSVKFCATAFLAGRHITELSVLSTTLYHECTLIYNGLAESRQVRQQPPDYSLYLDFVPCLGYTVRSSASGTVRKYLLAIIMLRSDCFCWNSSIGAHSGIRWNFYSPLAPLTPLIPRHVHSLHRICRLPCR